MKNVSFEPGSLRSAVASVKNGRMVDEKRLCLHCAVAAVENF